MKEQPALVREAFEYYYALGVDRSYAKVAIKYRKAISTIEKWGKTYLWRAKIEERENEKRKKATEQAIVEKELDHTQRNLKIIRRGILECAKGIQSGTLKPSYKVLVDLIEAERKILTGNVGEIHINHRIEIGKMSNEEIEQKINDKLSKLLEFKKMESFSTIKDPIIDVEVIKHESEWCF